MNNNYNWTDNPTVSGVALCDTDVLNDCLMHLKYNNESGSGFSLFDIVAKDHVLSTEESKGFAALGSYVYNEAVTGRYGYPDFYNKCLAEFQDSVQETITVGSYSFSGYKNINGHIFYNIADKGVVDAIYSSTGAAWYYGIDTENERIFLPRNDWFFQNGNSQNVGSFKEAGLPNITGEMKYVCFRSGDRNNGDFSGALYKTQDNNSSFGSQASWGSPAVGFNASYSNSIYGKSNTVQPPAVKAVYYMVVGNISDVNLTTVELTSDSAEAPITFDSETHAVKLSLGDGLSVDTDGNLTGLTIQQAAHSAMPSTSYRWIDLSLGASGTTYVAPSDGWFVLRKMPNGANQYIALGCGSNGLAIKCIGPANNNELYTICPIAKGDSLWITYNAGGTTNYFRFVYAEGAE